MSEKDASATFAALLKQVKEANERWFQLWNEQDEARKHARKLSEELQAICPHRNITECPEHEEYLDGQGFPTTTIEAERRCETCGLTQSSWHKDAVLFRSEVTRTVDDHVAFKNAGVQYRIL